MKPDESLFQGLLESAPDGIVIVNREGKIVLVNTQAERMFGYRREELLGQEVEILVPERFWATHVEQRTSYIRQPRTRPMGAGLGLAGRRKDGSEIPVEISLSPLETKEGLLITAVIRDVTDRKKAEEEQRRRAHQQAVVAQLGRRALSGIDVYALMDEATALTAHDLQVEYCDVFELLPDGKELLLQAGTGWKNGVVGRATVSVKTSSPAGYALLSQEPVIIEDLHAAHPFSDVALLLEQGVASSLSVLIYGRERPFGVLGAHTVRRRRFTPDDVHILQAIANVLAAAVERKRHEQQQRERDLQRAEQMVALGQVAAGVAHELRNPLTSIKGLVQVNRKEAEARGLPAEDLQIIEQEIRRMERTLQTFLDFARPSQPQRRCLPLAPLVDRVFALVAGRAHKQHVTLRFRQPADAVSAEVDGDQIQQLLLNLVLNGLDAMPKGGTVEVTLHPAANGWIEFRVIDSGPGISPQVLPRLFEPFVSSKETGLGLGLAVSRRIAEDHGGSLSAQNQPEGGACFVLRLPAPS